jgi:hypothetical protein
MRVSERIGVKAWLEVDPARADLFEYDFQGRSFSFPCVVCKHQERPGNQCAPCCHYATIPKPAGRFAEPDAAEPSGIPG